MGSFIHLQLAEVIVDLSFQFVVGHRIVGGLFHTFNHRCPEEDCVITIEDERHFYLSPHLSRRCYAPDPPRS